MRIDWPNENPSYPNQIEHLKSELRAVLRAIEECDPNSGMIIEKILYEFRHSAEDQFSELEWKSNLEGK